MKKILNIFSMLLATGFVYAQTTSENYIQTRTYLEPVTTINSAAKQVQTVEYFDGLGRSKQIINVKATPSGNDIVTPIVYDNYGMQTKNYLPIPQNSTSNGNIYSPDPNAVNFPVNDITNFYQGEKIYSESIVELSPLKRIQQKKQVGNAWSSKPVNFTYETNTVADAVKQYQTITTWNPTDKVFTNSIPSLQAYQVNTLYKNSVKDEDGNETITFKNLKGQIILSRKSISNTEKADTYYVYNKYNQLVYVIPPLASLSSSLDTSILGKLCYQYIYDSKNRPVEKKLPGKQWEYTVYDKADRLILIQDSNLKSQNRWLITKYDRFGRVAYTGFLTGGDRLGRQNEINDLTITETRNTTGFTRNGITIYYTENSFVNEIPTILSVNYYDTYPPNSPASVNLFSQNLLTDNLSNSISTKGFPLASYVKNIEDDEWTKSYSWYDTKGRNTSARNEYPSGGHTTIDNKLDFSGVVLEAQTYHKKSTNDPDKIITETFEYDPQFRLLKHWHQINGFPQELLTNNTYNALSQLTNKKVGGTLGNPLQSINYQYNIKGALTKINDPQNLNDKLFGYEIKYQNPSNISATPRYNGNISEVDWKTANGTVLKRYYYQYDGLDRLKDAIYEEPSTTVPPSNNYDESLTYDVNGNIKTLKRFTAAGGVPMMIDDLSYNTYDGNQLISVIDLTNNNIGYPSGGNSIVYDSNGNMISHLDKEITNINYNFLDLPSSVIFSYSNASLSFKYRANGTKIQQVYTYLNPRSGSLISTDTNYIDGFQYIGSGLSFYPTSEGYYDFKNNRYVYLYKDQVGNNRLAYYKGTTGLATIDKETNYYPLGMEYFGANGTYPLNNTYNYGFQEQEKQEQTGWNSFRWRNYDSTMGRFFNIDPLSEKYAYQAHYNFSENRVINSREIEGLEADDNYEHSRFDDQDYDGGVDYADQIEAGVSSIDLSWKVSDFSFKQDMDQENDFDFNNFVSDALFGLGSDEARDNYNGNRSRYEDLTKRTGADEIERDFYYMFGGALAAPFVMAGVATVTGVSAEVYVGEASIRFTSDIVGQLIVNGRVDNPGQTLINTVVGGGSSGTNKVIMAVANTVLNTINNASTAASKDPANQPSNSNLAAAALILTTTASQGSGKDILGKILYETTFQTVSNGASNAINQEIK